MADIDSWLPIIAEDIAAARHCVRGRPPALRVAAYHCQQAAEKIVKAHLIAAGVDPERTHDIERLCSLLPSQAGDRAMLEQLDRFTPYAIEYRYPPEDGPLPPPPDPSEVESWCDELESHLDRLKRLS